MKPAEFYLNPFKGRMNPIPSAILVLDNIPAHWDN